MPSVAVVCESVCMCARWVDMGEGRVRGVARKVVAAMLVAVKVTRGEESMWTRRTSRW